MTVLGVLLIAQHAYVVGVPLAVVGFLALIAVVMYMQAAGMYMRTILYRFATEQPDSRPRGRCRRCVPNPVRGAHRGRRASRRHPRAAALPSARAASHCSAMTAPPNQDNGQVARRFRASVTRRWPRTGTRPGGRRVTVDRRTGSPAPCRRSSPAAPKPAHPPRLRGSSASSRALRRCRPGVPDRRPGPATRPVRPLADGARITHQYTAVVSADLAALRHDLAVLNDAGGKRHDGAEPGRLAARGAQTALTAAQAHVTQQATLITSLQSCLGGVEQALNALSVGNQGRAIDLLNAVSTQLHGCGGRQWLSALPRAGGGAGWCAPPWRSPRPDRRRRMDRRRRTHDGHGNEAYALDGARSHLADVRHHVTTTQLDTQRTTTKRDTLHASIGQTLDQLEAVNASLQTTNVHAYLQGVNISTLQTCLGGVQTALAQIRARNNNQAARDISAVSGPCTQLAGGAGAGLVYPFNFPDPDVILVGHTYYAYATNSVAGNIQIIRVERPDPLDGGGQRPPEPSRLGHGRLHLGAGGGAAERATSSSTTRSTSRGTTDECISVATATQPQGPYIDKSAGPLECQKALGGSIDPSSFVDANGTPYLVWKSGGPGSSAIWSQPLTAAGTAFVPGTNPTLLLTPGQSWESGTVEAPDLVAGAGRYFLFFSGNDWNTADYAVGAATCAGPLGPCTDSSTTPILASGDNMAGPGGESVFDNGAGAFFIAFHAWVPGSVGFPNSRELYIRSLTLSGLGPVVGTG